MDPPMALNMACCLATLHAPDAVSHGGAVRRGHPCSPHRGAVQRAWNGDVGLAGVPISLASGAAE